MLDTFRALAEPGRLQIVELLLRGPRPVGEVAERLGMRQPQATKHLQVLRAAGLVDVQPVAQRRMYTICPKPFTDMERWLRRCRERWEDQFERLDAVLDELQTQQRPLGRRKRKP